MEHCDCVGCPPTDTDSMCVATATGFSEFGWVQHLTRGRPLTDNTGADTRGQTRSTHTCDLLREQGGPVVPCYHAMRPELLRPSDIICSI